MTEKMVLQKLTFLNFPYVNRLIDTTKDENHLYFMMEAYHCGHLHLHITDSKDKGFSPTVARNYAAEIVSVLFSLATCGCVHRDIKPKNFMIDSIGHLKLCDFGDSKILFPGEDYDNIYKDSSSCPRTYSIVGTLHYMAPEVLAKTYGYSLQG